VSRARPTSIPTRQRKACTERDAGRCPRCGAATIALGEIHHRRSRRVHDEHTHALGNLARLCRTCHRDVTVNITQARADGWVVSSYEPDPSSVPVKTFAGWRYHLDDGTIAAAPEPVS
jgi:5-methylcytosine-specific restriction endonuclease McrA